MAGHTSRSGSMIRPRNPRAMASIILVVGAAILSLPVFHYLLGLDRGFLSPLGFESGLAGAPVGWMAGFVTAGAFIAFTVRGIPMVAQTWLELSPLKVLSVYAAVVAALVEEAFFRRFVMELAADFGAGAILQVIASAALFGGAHAVWGLAKRDLAMAARVTLATGVMGGCLAVVYLLSDRSLAPCVVAHFLITAALEPGLMIAAVSGEMSGRAASEQSR